MNIRQVGGPWFTLLYFYALFISTSVGKASHLSIVAILRAKLGNCGSLRHLPDIILAHNRGKIKTNHLYDLKEILYVSVAAVVVTVDGKLTFSRFIS